MAANRVCENGHYRPDWGFRCEARKVEVGEFCELLNMRVNNMGVGGQCPPYSDALPLLKIQTAAADLDAFAANLKFSAADLDRLAANLKFSAADLDGLAANL